MRVQIVERTRLNEKAVFVTRYTPGEYVLASILTFLLNLFFIWPIELFVLTPLKWVLVFIIWLFQLLINCIWWLIRLPFCLLFKRHFPEF